MFKSKTATVITLTLAICAMANQASAQTNLQALETAQPILSHPTQPVKSTEAERKVLPKEMTARKITRIVKPVTAQSTAMPQLQQNSAYSGVINATASEQNETTRFIYNRRKGDTHMPVYFSEESLKSK